MSIKLLMEINDNLIMATLFHREQSDLMTFLSLRGFSALHEYQNICESDIQRRLKEFIIRTYCVAPLDFIPESADVLKPLIDSKKRNELSKDKKCDIVKQAFDAYEKWETQSLALYENVAKELSNAGDIKAYSIVKNIVDDVAEELAMVNDMINSYALMGWDMAQIVGEQNEIAEKYIYKMRKLYEGYPVLHHYNSL